MPERMSVPGAGAMWYSHAQVIGPRAGYGLSGKSTYREAEIVSSASTAWGIMGRWCAAVPNCSQNMAGDHRPKPPETASPHFPGWILTAWHPPQADHCL